ncbi:hypothetical protein SDJN02_15209, partial [Cucurbita argyrosperma subsp. argyrosperma]
MVLLWNKRHLMTCGMDMSGIKQDEYFPKLDFIIKHNRVVSFPSQAFECANETALPIALPEYPSIPNSSPLCKEEEKSARSLVRLKNEYERRSLNPASPLVPWRSPLLRNGASGVTPLGIETFGVEPLPFDLFQNHELKKSAPGSMQHRIIDILNIANNQALKVIDNAILKSDSKLSSVVLLATTVDSGPSSGHGTTRDPDLNPPNLIILSSEILLKSARFVSGFEILVFSLNLLSGMYSSLSFRSPEGDFLTETSTFQSRGFLRSTFWNIDKLDFLSPPFKALLLLAVVADEASGGVDLPTRLLFFLGRGASRQAEEIFLDPDNVKTCYLSRRIGNKVQTPRPRDQESASMPPASDSSPPVLP